MTVLVVLILIVLSLWAIGRFYLQGENLDIYDRVPPAAVGGAREPSAEHHDVIELLRGFAGALDGFGRAGDWSRAGC